MKYIIWLEIAILLILHQDFWNWNDRTLHFGFVPSGLFYHACLSLGAAGVWLSACLFAWPDDIAEFEEETEVSPTEVSPTEATQSGDPS